MAKRRGPAREVGLLLVALSSLSGDAAGAERGGVRLVVARAPGAESCPDDEALLSRLLALRGGEPPASGRATVEVRMRPGGAAFEADAAVLVASTPPLRRSMRAEGPGCERLAESLAVALLVLLDEAGDRAKAEAAAGAAPAAEASEEARPGGGPRGVWLGASGLVGWAVPRGITPGLEAGIRASLGHGLAAGASLAHLSGGAFDAAGGEVSLSLDAVRLGLCRVGGGEGGYGALCAAAAAGSLRARVSGLDEARDTSRPWLSLGLAVEAGVPVGSFAWVTARIDGLGLLKGQRLLVEGFGEVYDAPRFGLVGGLGLSVRLW